MPEPAPAPSPSQATSQTPPALTPTDLLDSIKIVLAVVGGVGAVVALTVAYRKQRDSEVAEYREDARAFTERFTAATDQLGGSSAAVRLAGVYAMAELADDWRDGRQMCIDVLCGYLRIPDEARIPETTPVTAPVTAPATTSGTSATTSSSEREVPRTLIRVIRDHLREEAPVPWSDRKFSFEGAIFEQGDLSKIHLKYPGHIPSTGRLSEQGTSTLTKSSRMVSPCGSPGRSSRAESSPSTAPTSATAR